MSLTNLFNHTLRNIKLLSADDDLLALVKSPKGLNFGGNGRSVAVRGCTIVENQCRVRGFV